MKNLFNKLGISLISILMLFYLVGCKTEWKPYASKTGKFLVTVPSDFAQQENALTRMGNIQMYILSKDQVMYMVAYADYTKDFLAQTNPDKLLKHVATEASKHLSKAKVQTPNSISNQGIPGIELQVEGYKDKTALKMRGRFYLREQRLYQVIAIYPIAQEKLADKYLQSFTFIQKPDPQKTQKPDPQKTQKPDPQKTQKTDPQKAQKTDPQKTQKPDPQKTQKPETPN
jgi:hypothetical protein